MKERPILFSGEMVKAILEGRKTQTRRIIKSQPFSWAERFEPAPFKNYGTPGGWWIQMTQDEHKMCGLCKCPYGIPGDRLWVRETWTPESWTYEYGKTPPAPTDRPVFHHSPEHYDDQEYWLIPHYKATDPTPELAYDDMDSDEPHCRWRPSIHMPRWASRITLEIVNVRVERLQEITEEGAKAEGIEYERQARIYHRYEKYGKIIGWFANLWDSHNAKRGYSWESNPWVFVIEFRRIDQ
jgi:hypothetical protein